MTYQETVDWMFQQLPMYQQLGSKAYRVNLSNIEKLSRHLEDPHNNFKTIHVGGTNGKGSVSHMLASVLQESGLKVGLYTSPHLKDFRERIKINGKEIDSSDVVSFIDQNRAFFEQENLSFFEMTVGMAFDYFSREEVDVAVIEVGLGGRLDSTNIIYPELSVITNIGFDHVAMLGNTLPLIAGEKAGIIKNNIPVVIGETHPETLPVFRRVATERNAPLVLTEEMPGPVMNSDLKGSYQKKNISTALAALGVLNERGWNLPLEAIERGLMNVIGNTGLRGRWEVLQQNPRVICDTAHNREGLAYAMKQLMEEEFDDLHIVLGMVNDKDLSRVLPLFPEKAIYYFCRPNIPRGLEADTLQEKGREFGLHGKAYNSVSKAYDSALKATRQRDLIYAGGSTFTVAEII